MKEKNLPLDYQHSSLEELTKKANNIIESLESEKNLKDEKDDQARQEVEEDEFNPTLAAMENEIKPKILETVNKLTKDYTKLIKYQKEKLDCVLNSSEFTNSKEKSYQKIVAEILENIKSLQLSPAVLELSLIHI